MSILHAMFCPHFVILSAVTNYLLATLPLDFWVDFWGNILHMMLPRGNDCWKEVVDTLRSYGLEINDCQLTMTWASEHWLDYANAVDCTGAAAVRVTVNAAHT